MDWELDKPEEKYIEWKFNKRNGVQFHKEPSNYNTTLVEELKYWGY